MELLMQLKYSFNRGYTLSLLLIHLKEISFLSILVVGTFAPFYQSVFQIIAFPPPYFTNVSVSLAAINLFLVILTLAPTWSRFSFLKPIWHFSGLVLKMFPYLIAVPLLSYSLGSAIHNNFLGRIASIINIFFTLAYLFLHEFLNESLKFKESDFCNRRLISFPEQFIFVLTVSVAMLLGSFYGCLAYLFRTIFQLSRLYNSF